MALLDGIFGKAPEYDPESDPLAQPDEREAKDPAFHVRQDARRYATVMHAVTNFAAEGQSTRRLLIVIIVLLVLNKAIDLSVLTGLVH